jgi:crotonobetainyl-CoA:carnitine CoA-transferase CaiB-like acyl-CoA transferase
MQAVIPKLHHHGGQVWRTGPDRGEDNTDVFCGLLGLSEDEVNDLAEQGVI